MYRQVRNKSKTIQADNEHLHSLIKRRWVRKYFINQPAWFRNGSVAPVIWVTNSNFGGLGLAVTGVAKDIDGIFCGFCYALRLYLPIIQEHAGHCHQRARREWELAFRTYLNLLI